MKRVKRTTGVMFEMPNDLHLALKSAAAAADRTLSGEMRQRLAASIRRDQAKAAKAKTLEPAE